MLRTEVHENRPARSPVMFSRTRHFSFADPAGRMQIDSAGLGTSGVKVFCVRSTGHEVALVEDTHVNVIVPRRGRIAVASEHGDHVATPGMQLIFPPNERRTVVHPDNRGVYEAHVLAVPRTSLAALPDATCLGPSDEPARALSSAIARLMAHLRTGAPDDLDVVAARLADLVEAIADRTGQRGGVAAGGLAHVRLAEDYMRAHAGRALRMAEIAGAAGIGLRSLQVAFVRHRGLTPLAALGRFRLEQARLRLLEATPGSRVTDIALLSGFTHLGRFSQDYARRFGEPPSATLRRVLAR